MGNWKAETCYFSASMIWKSASHVKMNMIYCDAPNISELSSVEHAAIGYIAGYVVRMAKRRTPRSIVASIEVS